MSSSADLVVSSVSASSQTIASARSGRFFVDNVRPEASVDRICHGCCAILCHHWRPLLRQLPQRRR